MKEHTKLSPLSLAILGLISQKPQSGYDLRKMFSATPLGHFSSSPGAIYPALKRIETSGWVRGSIDKKKALRPKMVYRLTRKGQDVLRQQLLQPVTPDDVIWHMDDLMLRFAFMDEIVGRNRTLHFLSEFLSEIEAHVASLRQYMDQADQTLSPCGKLAMQNGIDGYQMNASWARKAIRQLQAAHRNGKRTKAHGAA